MEITLCPHLWIYPIIDAGICECVYYIPRIPSNMSKNLKDARFNPPWTCQMQDVCSLEGEGA
jgi:hypothetical protein